MQHDTLSGIGGRGRVARLVERFTAERSIKWVLGVGVVLMFGSSLMLVTSHWEDISSTSKLGVFLAYTVALWGAGEATRRRPGLRLTSSVLLALTVLLLPLNFVALNYARDFRLLLFAVQLAISVPAAYRIFHHFLRAPQPTFLAAYLILCVAGFLAPMVASWPHVAGLILWLVFAAGTVKVNRHVFWLTEKARLPPVFGFFPVLLLASQFLTISLVYLAPAVDLAWLGFASGLVAIPVLLTADAVARVFQERTGDLVRPFPWPVMLPLICGSLFGVAGVCLAATGLAPSAPPAARYALVPSALLLAVAMGVLTARFRHVAFVWGTLGAATLAYNFAPTYFIDFARAALDLGARAVAEERLPYAFYGLTYLPLVIGGLGSARYFQRRGVELVARPLRQYIAGLSLVLLALAATHAKAILPVAGVLSAVLLVAATRLRDRWIALAGAAAWIGAGAGLVPFARACLGRSLPVEWAFWCVAVSAGMLFAAGLHLDPSFGRMAPRPPSSRSRPWIFAWLGAAPCQRMSCVATLLAGATWLASRSPLPAPAPAPDALAWLNLGTFLALLTVHALRGASERLGYAVVISGLCGVGALCAGGGAPVPDAISGVTLAACGIWIFSRLLERSPFAGGNLARVFVEPSRRVAGFTIPGLAVYVYVPLLLYATFVPWEEHALFGLWPPACVLGVLSCLGVALRTKSRFLSLLGGLGVLAGSGSLLSYFEVPEGRTWLPVAWTVAATACGSIPWISRRIASRTAGDHAVVAAPPLGPALSTLDGFAHAVLVLAATLTPLSFTWPARLAGVIALAALSGSIATRSHGPAAGAWRSLVLAALNWQLVSALVSLLAPGASDVLDLGRHALPVSLPVAAVAGASTLAWTILDRRHAAPLSLLGLPGSAQRGLLRALFGLGVWASLSMPGLEALDLALALTAFASLALSELWAACRRSSERRAGIGLGVIAGALGYLAYFEIITFGRGLTMYLLVAGAFLLRALAACSARHAATSVLAPPFRRVAMVLPAVSVLWGVARHIAVAPTWIGSGSLALFLAGGFYFWRGLEERRRALIILSGTIANIAFLLLWRDLDLSDPQFYLIPLGLSVLGLVEVLKREIPARLVDPLRYLGALLILVSPTFHIAQGSWLHIASLMVASVGVVLLSIAARVRALMYTGTAFLVADLAAVIVRGSIDHPSLLWIAGAGLGTAVLALGALAENHRDELLGRIRRLSARLETWE